MHIGSGPVRHPPADGSGERRVGPYVLTRQMGRGGTGIVFEARSESGRQVAVKLAHSSSHRLRDLLRREAAMLARLARHPHPGIVQYLDGGLAGGEPWYAMDYVVGLDLGRRMRAPAGDPAPTKTVTNTADLPLAGTGGASDDVENVGRHPPAAEDAAACIGIVRNLADALGFLHERGIVHGDVTPRNVVVRPDLQPVLVDFGTALYSGSGTSTRDVAQVEARKIGTPGFMAPEQIRGEPLDARADLYALGCILFEALSGRPPFESAGPQGVLHKHLNAPTPRLRDVAPHVPPVLDSLVYGLLQKDPFYRIGRAEDVVDALDRVLETAPRETRSRTAAVLYRARLAGRDEPRQTFFRKLHDVAAGRGCVSLLVGERGIGKTRLANELTAEAVEMQMDVLTASCAPVMQMRPLEPLAPVIRAFADFCQSQRQTDDALKRTLDLLRPYDPGLRDAEGVLAPLQAPSPGEGRARVANAVIDALRALGERSTTVVVIDDIHWADELTTAVLCLGHRLADTRVMILAICRALDELDPELRTYLERQASPVTLGKLDADGVRAIARDMLGTSVLPDGIVEGLMARSEGNPFFVTEYLRAAVERGFISRNTDGRWSVSPTWRDPSAALPTPAALSEILVERCQRLSPAARQALELAAMLGREFTSEHLTALEEQSDDPLPFTWAEALDELIAARVLEERPGGRYRFAYEDLSSVNAAATPPDRRARLHQRIATRLESLLRADAAAVEGGDAVLGMHWAEAGDAVRAFECLERAARSAESAFATSRATTLYRLALKQLTPDLLAVPGWATRSQATHEALGDILVRAGEHTEGRERLAEALVFTRDALARARLHRKRGASYITQHAYAEAEQELDRAEQTLGDLENLDAIDERREWVDIQQNRFSMKYFARLPGDDTQALVRRVAPVVLRDGTPLQRTVFFQCAASDVLARCRFAFSEEAVDYARKALESADAGVQRMLAHFGVGFALLVGRQGHGTRGPTFSPGSWDHLIARVMGPGRG